MSDTIHFLSLYMAKHFVDLRVQLMLNANDMHIWRK